MTDTDTTQRYVKLPIPVAAHEWNANGDHPDDGDPSTEGDVVRYFRHPDYPGQAIHTGCGRTWDDHGWIDTLEAGHTVCPGDRIITGVKGEHYPCKPDIFATTYRLYRGDGGLVAHAEAELARLGEDEHFAAAIVAAVEAFASYGHSGGSAPAGVAILTRLLSYQELTPLTSDPDEWEDRSEVSGHPMWQSKRNPAVFSDDGGQTAYHVDTPDVPVELAALAG